MQEINNLVTVFLATIGSYEADSLIVAVAIAATAWILSFGYFVSTRSEKPFWKSAPSGQRKVLLWSWLWTASAISVLVGGWGFLTWRLSNGLMLVPTAPELLEGVVFGIVLFAVAILLFVGWLPRVLLPESNSATEAKAPIKRTAPVDEPLSQPLYPGLSFGATNQTTTRTQVEETPADQEVQAEDDEPVSVGL